jgi:hypothetical protein
MKNEARPGEAFQFNATNIKGRTSPPPRYGSVHLIREEAATECHPIEAESGACVHRNSIRRLFANVVYSHFANPTLDFVDQARVSYADNPGA